LSPAQTASQSAEQKTPRRGGGALLGLLQGGERPLQGSRFNFQGETRPHGGFCLAFVSMLEFEFDGVLRAGIAPLRWPLSPSSVPRRGRFSSRKGHPTRKGTKKSRIPEGSGVCSWGSSVVVGDPACPRIHPAGRTRLGVSRAAPMPFELPPF